MLVGYEAKRIFHNKTGLGNYSRDLVRIMATYYPENQYFLYNPKKNKESLFTSDLNNIFEKLPATSFYKKYYSTIINHFIDKVGVYAISNVKKYFEIIWKID